MLDTCEIEISNAIEKFSMYHRRINWSNKKKEKEIDVKPNLKIYSSLIQNKQWLTLIYIRSYHWIK